MWDIARMFRQIHTQNYSFRQVATRSGFDTGQQITVKVMNGCIVLMVYGEQEQRLQDELQEANQKLNRIESTLATLQ